MPPHRHDRNSAKLGIAILLAIMAIAAVLRMPVNHGEFRHPDEAIAEAVVSHIRETGRIDTNWANAPDMHVSFKYDQHNFAGYNVVLTGWDIITDRTFLGAVRSVDRFRHFSAGCYLLTIALAFALARRISGSLAAGGIAAAFTALSGQLFQDSLYGRPESLATSLVLLVALLLVTAEDVERPRRRLFAAAALSGFLFSIKISFIGYLPVVLVALILHRSGSGSGRLPATVPSVAPSIAAAILLFVLGAWLGMPNATLSEYLSGIEALRTQYAGHHWPYGLGPSVNLAERMAHGGTFVLGTQGALVAGLALAGLALTLRERRWVVASLVALSMAYVVYFMSRPVFFERNFSHALPLVFISAAHGIDRISRLATKPRYQVAVQFALAVAALAPSALILATLRFGVLTGALLREREAAVTSAAQNCQCEVLEFGYDYPAAERALALNGPVILRVSDVGEHSNRLPGEPAEGTLRSILRSPDAAPDAVRLPGPFHALPTSTLHTYHVADEVLIRLPQRASDASTASVSIVPTASQIAAGAYGTLVENTGWTRSGLLPWLQAHTIEDPVFGSWNGDDRHRAEMQIAMGTCRSFIVRRGLGPQPKRQSLVATWAVNGQPAETRAPNALPSPPHGRRRQAVDYWTTYRFDLPAGAESIRVTVRDDGDGDGETSAVTLPRCVLQ